MKTKIKVEIIGNGIRNIFEMVVNEQEFKAIQKLIEELEKSVIKNGLFSTPYIIIKETTTISE